MSNANFETSLSQTQIARTIKENIANKNCVFVFNTAVAAETWSDFVVAQEGKNGWPKTLASQRFIAWDEFKAQAASARQDGAAAVPALVRKLFARTLLSKIRGGEKIFEWLINSDYPESALAFTNWLSSILPSLGFWKNLMEEKKFLVQKNSSEENSNCEFLSGHDTPQNRDYLKLFFLYEKFLKSENLFEPTWQKLEFNSANKNFYIIFFPELLDDFFEYQKILEEQEQKQKLKLVRIQKSQNEIHANFYSSLRAELRMTALKILQEHEGGVEWSDISVSVPEIENYLPYVEREFFLYDIPFVTRAGSMLGKTGAGLAFKKIRDAFEGGFAFSLVRSLALCKNIPWKNPDAMRALVRLGSELKCFLQYTDSNGKLVDPWEKNLPEAKEFQNEIYLETQEFYKQLKKAVTKICCAKSFSSIKNAWAGADGFEKKFFLPKESMSKSANNILSRCVKKLDELAKLEKQFPEICKSEISHFDFFLEEIESTQYSEQTKRGGVSIFPYKLSAAAAIKKQFVINASQKAVTVENPLLAFLPQESRRRLLSEDALFNDESQSYIEAYNKAGTCVFSVSQETLSGFAIPHAAFSTSETPCDFEKDLDEKDYFKKEKLFLKNFFAKENSDGKENSEKKAAGGGIENAGEGVCETQGGGIKKTANFPKRISKKIKNGFDFYFFANGFFSKKNPEQVSQLVQKKILERISQNEKITISQSAMKNFFPCPRKWIFKSVLRLEEDTLDTDIFERYDAGKINHKILELFLRSESRLPKTCPKTLRLFEEEKIFAKIKRIVEEGVEIDGKIELPFNECKAFRESSLAKEILISQTKNFVETILNFLRWFCQENLYGEKEIFCVEKKLQKKIQGEFFLDGKIDCMLKDEGGEDFFLVDFKNKKSAIPKSGLTLKGPATQEDELGDFQMPAYFELWSGNAENAKREISSARFVPINVQSFEEEGKEVVVQEGKATTTHATRNDFIAYTLPLFDEYVRKMCDAIKTKNYCAKNVQSEDCNGEGGGYACDFRAVCRKIFNTAGDAIVTGEKQ